MTLQIIFALLWVAGLIVVVVGIYYGVSLLLLGAVSRIFPLTGRRQRARSNKANREHPPSQKA
jgi:hypothetical protein